MQLLRQVGRALRWLALFLADIVLGVAVAYALVASGLVGFREPMGAVEATAKIVLIIVIWAGLSFAIRSGWRRLRGDTDRTI